MPSQVWRRVMGDERFVGMELEKRMGVRRRRRCDFSC